MQNSSNLQYLGLIVLATLCRVAVRAALGFANQRCATTYHHTMSYVLLLNLTIKI